MIDKQKSGITQLTREKVGAVRIPKNVPRIEMKSKRFVDIIRTYETFFGSCEGL